MGDRLVELATEMLDDTNSTLWGQAYDISDPKRREAAAGWFAGQVRRLLGGADMLSFHGARYEWGGGGVLECVDD